MDKKKRGRWFFISVYDLYYHINALKCAAGNEAAGCPVQKPLNCLILHYEPKVYHETMSPLAGPFVPAPACSKP